MRQAAVIWFKGTFDWACMAEFDWWSYGAFKLTPLACGYNTGKSRTQNAYHLYISEDIKTLLLHLEATKVNKQTVSLWSVLWRMETQKWLS